ncbi:hypothetical protein, partial [Escherichia coli]|uniref:hypothetical protein n=1 Tax=Escherichia coli TaxID=562 RepID=UPI001BE441E1
CCAVAVAVAEGTLATLVAAVALAVVVTLASGGAAVSPARALSPRAHPVKRSSVTIASAGPAGFLVTMTHYTA